MSMKWVVGNMRYTLDLIIVSIGIIGSFQLVSILTLFWYTHMCLKKRKGKILSIDIKIVYLQLVGYLFTYQLVSRFLFFNWYHI